MPKKKPQKQKSQKKLEVKKLAKKEEIVPEKVQEPKQVKAPAVKKESKFRASIDAPIVSKKTVDYHNVLGETQKDIAGGVALKSLKLAKTVKVGNSTDRTNFKSSDGYKIVLQDQIVLISHGGSVKYTTLFNVIEFEKE